MLLALELRQLEGPGVLDAWLAMYPNLPRGYGRT